VRNSIFLIVLAAGGLAAQTPMAQPLRASAELRHGRPSAHGAAPARLRGAPAWPAQTLTAQPLRYNRRERPTIPLPSTPHRVIAVYPGSFDPITNGHLDLIDRGARLCDRLIVAILRNEEKEPLFTIEERIDMLREVVRGYPTVEVDSFNGLLVQYAQEKGASVILRGIRAISDYEYELQMALMNRRLSPAIETVFLMAREEYSFISSRLVKQVIGLGGNIAGLVPPSVEVRLRSRVLDGQ